MAQPEKYEIKFVQGDDVEEVFRFKDSTGAVLDVTGWSGASQIRASKGAAEVVATFGVAIDHVTAPGVVMLTLSRAITETIEPGKYVWDLEVIDANDRKQTILEGDVVVTQDVTEDE